MYRISGSNFEKNASHCYVNQQTNLSNIQKSNNTHF